MLDFLIDPNTIAAFLTLVALEIVLGIDNVIFITVLANRLPEDIRDRVRKFGLLFAVLTRIGMLFSLTWVMGLTEPLIKLGQEISGRDLILFFGGLFLLSKASREIYVEVEAKDLLTSSAKTQLPAGEKTRLFWGSIAQIAVLDMVFSLDSVITAVGLVGHLPIMIAAVLASVGVMLWAAKPIGDFVHKHPSIKVLALAFLTVIGVLLIAEAFDTHVPRGYVYFAMAFSLGVEILNIRARSRRRRP